jgi:hypothetical protein
MIRNSKRIIQNKQIQGKTGRDANESCFGGWERELREHKIITVPSIGEDTRMSFEQ